MARKKKPVEKEYSPDAKEKNGKWHDLVMFCIDQYEAIKTSQYRKATIAEIETSNRVYHQIAEATTDDPWPGASNIVLPLTAISVDNLEPRIHAGLVGQQPIVRFAEESEQEQSDNTKTIERWYNAELSDNVKIEDRTQSLTHQLLLDGTVYPLPEYDIEETTVKDFVFLTGREEQWQVNQMMAEGIQPLPNGMLVGKDGKVITTERREKKSEGGKIQLIPFTDIFIADDAEDWEKTNVYRKVYPTYGELKRYEEGDRIGYQNIGVWLLHDAGDGKKSDDQQSPAQSIDDIRETGKETIECLECTISYIYKEDEEEKEDIEDWREERYVAEIALDRGILIRLVRLRDLNWKNEHFIKRVRLYAEEGKAYGTSIYGKMRSIQDGASKTFNHCINVAEIVLMPWFFFTTKVGLKGDIVLHPGKGIQVDDLKDGILFPNFNINPAQYIDFLYLWTSFWERLISIGDLQIGRPAEERGKKTTATEVMAVLQEGNVKHNYQAKTVREEFLSVLRTLYDLYYQHMPLDKTFLWDGKRVPIQRQQMARKYVFTLVGSTEYSNKLIERKVAEDLFNLSVSDPQQMFNPVPIREDLLRTYNKTNLQEYIDPFMGQLSNVLKQMPQLKQVVQGAIQQAIETAKNLEAAAKEGAGEKP
uniref:Portal protein n=1 Tax=viral metagenome TaxID=1070528 RepID=A0A6M3JQZ6_9ZZZZ